MKTSLLSIFFLVGNIAFAQSNLTSIRDTLSHTALESIQTKLSKVDSITNQFSVASSELNNQYQKEINSIDQEVQNLNSKVDSLAKLNLPTNKFSQKVDSLNHKKDSIENKFNSKLKYLKQKTIGKLDKVELTPEMKGEVSALTEKINATSLANNEVLKIPSISLNGVTVPDIQQNLKDIPIEDVSEITEEVSGLTEDVKNISTGDLSNVQQLPNTVEEQALSRVDGLGTIQKESEAAKQLLKTRSDPKILQDQILKEAQKEAVNHFKGKEEVVQKAMEEVAKYKKHYSTVNSIKDVPKKPVNAMKGKPFIERFVPGVYLQYQNNRKDYQLDVNVYGSYKISGRFVGGLGWNQRFVYSPKPKGDERYKRIFGPRIFMDTKLGKGFWAHLETEAMYAFVPSVLSTSQDFGNFQWVSSPMLGIKKQYKIHKNLHGTALIQYNLKKQYLKTPYLDRLNSRIGFEYLLKRKVDK